jgi:hypothetical protein
MLIFNQNLAGEGHYTTKQCYAILKGDYRKWMLEKNAIE